MNFLSLNVCGIRDANKRMSLMQWLSHRRLDIVCLQETLAVSASESSAWFSPYGFLTVSTVGSARARGLAILYRPRLILNRCWVELCGRFSMAEFMNGNFLFRVVCIYAPNSNPERNSFLLSCADLIDPAIPTLLCGDFNAVWDRSKDRGGGGRLMIPPITTARPLYITFSLKPAFLMFGAIFIRTLLLFHGRGTMGF